MAFVNSFPSQSAAPAPNAGPVFPPGMLDEIYKKHMRGETVQPYGSPEPPPAPKPNPVKTGQMEAIGPESNVEGAQQINHNQPHVSVSMAQGQSLGTPGENLARLSGGDQDFTARLGAEPHVDLQALTQGSMEQDDILKAEMLRRAKTQQQTENVALDAPVDAAKREADIATSEATAQDPAFRERVKTQGDIAVARAPGQQQQQNDDMQRAAYEQLKPRAIAELEKTVPGFRLKAKTNPQAAQAMIDAKVKELAEPLDKSYSRYNYIQRPNGFN